MYPQNIFVLLRSLYATHHPSRNAVESREARTTAWTVQLFVSLDILEEEEEEEEEEKEEEEERGRSKRKSQGVIDMWLKVALL